MLIRKIHKYELKTCQFRRLESELSGSAISRYNAHAHLSILLKDVDECNLKIVFNTVEGYREVISTVWGATEKHLFLHGGDFVPLESVAQVTLE